MSRSFRKNCIVAGMLAAVLCIGGVSASWTFAASPSTEGKEEVVVSTAEFKYLLFYIARSGVVGGDYESASFAKTSDTAGKANLRLKGNANSSVQMEVVFYNNTNASYYYDETLTVSSSNSNIEYTVSGIAKKQEVKARSYVTLTLEFTYANASNLSNTECETDLQFKFAIDPDDIGGVVAESAVGKFAEVLNDTTSYTTLTDAMDKRGNQAWQVSYIGNVAGASEGDSAVINGLFGEEFMQMDLDGDGTPEEITMMIKRKNVDENTATGETAYEYDAGAEMALYITTSNFADVSLWNRTVDVWVVVYTKQAGENTKWEELVPLTKGTATANNYEGGWGYDSFDTDTWKSTDGKKIGDLATEDKQA